MAKKILKSTHTNLANGSEPTDKTYEELLKEIQLEDNSPDVPLIIDVATREVRFASSGITDLRTVAGITCYDRIRVSSAGRIITELGPSNYLIRVRTGELRSRVDEVAAMIGLTDKEMAKILNISERTLHRKPAAEPLDTNMSERLIQLESLITHGLDAFDGRRDTFARWMRSPRPALGDVSPISLLDTIAGFGFVDDELSRIEEGMIS